jgi:DNA processing protein
LIKKVNFADQRFPRVLKNIPSAPKSIFYKGDLFEKFNEDPLPAFAIVGSRRASSYGLDIAFRIAKDLAGFGLTIISGLAEGVDAAAHKGALAADGKTIAVLGCGVDVVYPYINRKLQAEIALKGSLISEFPLETQPRAEQFPSRNRIISGLAVGVLVVEGTLKSGTLITADMALSQGREVFALPGPVTSSLSATPNKLLKAGASLVECAEDILEELHLVTEAKRRVSRSKTKIYTKMPKVTEEEKQILSAISITPKKPEEIIYEIGLQCDTVNSILVLLEIRGYVSRTLDGSYQSRLT